MNSELISKNPAVDPANEWRPLAASARNVYIGVAVVWAFLITLVPTSIFVIAEDDSPGLYLAAALSLTLANTGIAAYIAFNRWRHTFWKLDDEALHVRRGKTWFKQLCVPRSRVQHLDFERGPLERRNGLATLVVHTAGSQNQALRQSGLLLADAEYLRDMLVPKGRRDGE